MRALEGQSRGTRGLGRYPTNRGLSAPAAGVPGAGSHGTPGGPARRMLSPAPGLGTVPERPWRHPPWAGRARAGAVPCRCVPRAAGAGSRDGPQGGYGAPGATRGGRTDNGGVAGGGSVPAGRGSPYSLFVGRRVLVPPAGRRGLLGPPPAGLQGQHCREKRTAGSRRERRRRPRKPPPRSRPPGRHSAVPLREFIGPRRALLGGRAAPRLARLARLRSRLRSRSRSRPRRQPPPRAGHRPAASAPPPRARPAPPLPLRRRGPGGGAAAGKARAGRGAAGDGGRAHLRRERPRGRRRGGALSGRRAKWELILPSFCSWSE